VYRIVGLACLLALVSSPAFGQGASSGSSLTGNVVDKDGGVIPGASVVVKNIATGETLSVVTNNSGVYSFPSLSAGTYSVTISLTGFKKVEIKEVRLLSGTPGNLGKTTLQIGELSETVEVRAATTDLVRTSPEVTSTISTELVSSLPRSDRNVLSFMIFLPGVSTSGGSQNSRNAEVAGLPQNTINISIDGVTTSNLLQSGDGFFTLVTPRPDTVEEVTLSTAAAGADVSGMGATQIKFVTRSGTNTFNTSLYWYFKNKALNANSFVNREINQLPKPQLTTNDFGGRVGGPIVIPGLFDGHGKAFFFFNMEEILTPNERSRARTILRDTAALGNFTYNNNAPRTVNLLDLAAANGQLTTVDPTVQSLIQAIRQTATSFNSGNIQQAATSPNTETFNYLISVSNKRHSPTGRVDINLSPRHRLSGNYYWERVVTDPDTLNSADPTFPGFPAQAGQFSFRTKGGSTLRSTFGSNLVNEALFGWQWSPVDFFGDSTPALFDNQAGYDIRMGFGLTNAAPTAASGPQARNTINWNIDDNLSWLRGNHNMKFGMSFTRISNWLENTRVVPRVDLGLSTAVTQDPALGMFTTTNFPTATSTDLNNARQLYGLLTGRVISLPGTGFLNAAGTEYIFNGLSRDAERQDNVAFYAADTWRWKPNVTVTAGLRYTVQFPMVATVGNQTGSELVDVCGLSGLGNGIGGRQCNLFQPGFVGNPGFTGARFIPLTAETKGYNLDLNNFGPNIGANWRPNVQTGWLRTLLGDPEQAMVSGGYSKTFNLERVDQFRNVYVGNPGFTVPATRGTGSTQFPLVDDGVFPLLLSQRNRLTQPDFQRFPAFPLIAASNQDLFVFDPDIQVPHTDSWTVGFQRAVARDMAVEIRYIGNRNRNAWEFENWNTENKYETGVLGTNPVDNVANQFAIAQQNLRANVAAGRGATFAFTGAPGTAPVPLFLAHFQGLAPGAAGDPANYTSTQFTNATWVDRLDPFSPDPQGIAANLYGGSSGSFFANARTAGYPANFWVANPAVDDTQVLRNRDLTSKYNSMQIELRRRFSRGLSAQVGYTYARGRSFTLNDLHFDLYERRSTQNPHQITTFWTWDLPVGRGKRFGTDWNRWVDGALGGWTFSGTGRVQVPLFRITNTRIVGMSQSDAQELFKDIRITRDGSVQIWSMPQDVIDNTILAYSADWKLPGFFSPGEEPTGRFFAPASRPAGFDGPNDPGCTAVFAEDCAPDLFFYGRWFGEFDFRISKKFPMGSKATFQMDVDVFNAFNAINFNQSFNPGDSSTIFRNNGQGSNARTGQLSWRITW
jgi:hypothetical protein